MATAKGLVVSDDKDRLSLLPDDILTNHILSLLPTLQAVRTSILARRWRHLWLYVPSLDFDDYEEVVVRVCACASGTRQVISDYVEWVDGIIKVYRGWGSAPLRHFRVRFCLDPGLSLNIQSWLMFSLAKGVEVLELESTKAPPRDSLCEFPSISPGQYPTLRYLKSLILGGLAITCDSLNHLLQGSEFLERLELRDLKSSGHVNVAGPISRLKSIDISGCYDFESIIISAPTPDLVSFIYPFCVLQVYLEHAPKLVQLSIGRCARDLILHPLFRYISQLEALHLNFSSWDELSCFPDLRRLKHLHLTIFGLERFFSRDLTRSKLRGLASLINAASCVQHLTLEVDYLYSRLRIIRDEFADLDLQHLRVIEIVGFEGRREHCDLALCLIKAAASSLEKLIIDLRCTGEDISRKEIDRRTSAAKELIEKEALSKVDLVFTGYKESTRAEEYIVESSDDDIWSP